MALHQNGGSSTCVVEPIELQNVSSVLSRPANVKLSGSRSSLHIHEALVGKENQYERNDPVQNLPSPTTAGAEKLERWNAPRLNFWRSMAAFWSFIVMGSNDAAYGVSSIFDLGGKKIQSLMLLQALIPYVRLH
jgi:hypothetical protein